MISNEWISMNDRLPEIGKDVLVYYPKWEGTEIQVGHLCVDKLTFDVCGGEFNFSVKKVTHWMPLPEAPRDINTECKCYHEGKCWGTKEMDPCECGGDEKKCDFYPTKRG